MGIHPIPLKGNWSEGYALDKHVLQSIPLGEDAYGHMHFDTTRSEIGELVYQLKYKYRIDCVDRIIDLAKPFISKWNAISLVDVVMPVPSSVKNRPFQPASEIAHGIAEYLKKPYVDSVLEKTILKQSKDMKLDEKKQIQGTIRVMKKSLRELNVLLVDDLYQTGLTLTECVRALRMDPNVGHIYVLAMSKTKVLI